MRKGVSIWERESHLKALALLQVQPCKQFGVQGGGNCCMPEVDTMAGRCTRHSRADRIERHGMACNASNIERIKRKHLIRRPRCGEQQKYASDARATLLVAPSVGQPCHCCRCLSCEQRPPSKTAQQLLQLYRSPFSHVAKHCLLQVCWPDAGVIETSRKRTPLALAFVPPIRQQFKQVVVSGLRLNNYTTVLVSAAEASPSCPCAICAPQKHRQYSYNTRQRYRRCASKALTVPCC